MIVCENLVKIYKTGEIEVVALQGLDLTVEDGELMAIIGNSGSDSDINDKNDTNSNIIQAEQSNGSSQKSNVADSNSDIAASLKTGQDYNITDTAILLFMIIISLIAVAVLCNYRKYNKKGHNGKYYKH